MQPIRRISGRRIVGYEALARFKGRSTEAVFEQARTDGSILELDAACLAAALPLVHLIPPPLYLSVNLAAETVVHMREVNPITLSADDRLRLVVELTEQSAGTVHELYHSLRMLRTLGVRYAVDDVGSAFGNVFRIAQLLPDFVKIDASFTHRLTHNIVNRAIVRSIAGMALELRADCVAEGIEYGEDLEWVASLGVRYAQGYLLGRPGPPDEVLGASE